MTLAVNVQELSGVALERRLADALKALLDEVSWLQGWRVEAGRLDWDLMACGPVPHGGAGSMCIECKGVNFRPDQLFGLAGRICQRGGDGPTAKVLAMPRVSDRMAEVCEHLGWSWYDLAGNCRLEIPGLLLVERTGRKPVPLPSRRGANLSTPKASQVIRALLVPENAGRRWTQREMAGHFVDLVPYIGSPSLALVNKIVQYLREQAFIEPLPGRGFRVIDHEGLLRAWVRAYRADRTLRRPYFTLLKGLALDERLRDLDPGGNGRLAYALYSAADRQAPVVRQPRRWLYVSPEFESEVASALEAKLVDSGENVVVLIPEDPGVFYGVEKGDDRVPRTNAVQTYVDLVDAGGRGEEAAEAILVQRLRPAWEGAGG